MTPSIEEVLFFKRDTIFIILVKTLSSFDRVINFLFITFVLQVSTRFAKNLLRVFQSEQPTQFGSTASVVSAFTEVGISTILPFLLCSHSILFNCLVRPHLCFLSFFLNSLVERFTRSISDIVWITPKPLVIWIPWRKTKTSKSLLR